MKDISQEMPAASAPDAEASQSVGQLLKQERLRQNKTLKELAEATCIHISTLEALEEENRRKLPAEVFVRGFISLYAQHLGLDPQDALNRYGRKTTAEWVSPGTGYGERKVMPPKPAPRRPTTGRNLVFVGLLAAAVLLGLWGYRQAAHPPAGQPAATTKKQPLSPAPDPVAAPEIEAVTDPWPEVVAEEAAREEEAAALLVSGKLATTPPAETGAEEETVPARPAPEESAPPSASARTAPASAAEATAVAASNDHALVLEAQFTETTWVQVRLDNRDPVEYLFQPGEKYSWQADSIELFLGNAGGADLVLNGEPQPPPGPSGKTARLRFADQNP